MATRGSVVICWGLMRYFMESFYGICIIVIGQRWILIKTVILGQPLMVFQRINIKWLIIGDILYLQIVYLNLKQKRYFCSQTHANTESVSSKILKKSRPDLWSTPNCANFPAVFLGRQN